MCRCQDDLWWLVGPHQPTNDCVELRKQVCGSFCDRVFGLPSDERSVLRSRLQDLKDVLAEDFVSCIFGKR